MKDKRWILGLVVVIAAIVALGLWGFKKNENNNGTTTTPQVSGESTEKPVYYDDNATVMEFYSDYCSWCIKEKDVLKKLGDEGYRVKPMNVGINQNYWKDYNISGTPIFIAKNGDRLEGFHDYDSLKAFLDQHK